MKKSELQEYLENIPGDPEVFVRRVERGHTDYYIDAVAVKIARPTWDNGAPCGPVYLAIV
jgi:hypothetical protein